MLLSRKWLDEFVHVDANDKDFAEAMTLSGSKVETTEDRGAEISNIVVGTILTMERHPDSDHMWICQLDVGQSAPIQIVTGAWNIHPGDMVPVALDHSTLPGGKKIEKGKLRGVESNGMMCGLYELGLDERDFPYAAIVPAAILNDYHPLDKDKPSIPADIQPGDKVFGPVVCAKILECASQPDYTFHTCLDLGGSTAVPDTICPNLHEGDLVAPSAPWRISTPTRRSSPTASPTASSSSTRKGSRTAMTSSPLSARMTMWWSSRSPPTAPTASASSVWPGRWPPPTSSP